VHRAFSGRGRRTCWPYANQKGYAYAQALERDLCADMRVIVVGPLLFGYYRDAPAGDFRASGMGRVRKEALPSEALEQAWQISRQLGIGAVAVDFIVDQDCQQRKVIEFSGFIQVDTPEQLAIDGQPGVYLRCDPGYFMFRPGQYWLPELGLAEALGRACHLDTEQLLRSSVEAH
jgi:hypothetical protein